MNELPPDAPRLRAILAHLDQQIADTDTVGTYLRLQRGAVVSAISRAERQAIPRPVIAAPKRPPALADRRDTAVHPSARFIIELPEKAGQAAPIHTSSCTKTLTRSRPIEADLARQGLVNDPRGFTACTMCRPDTELGIDVA
ncbi:DUF6233 domain-containing protein [Streptomyces sp. NPDC001068]|uniref:DUF6233 domain-containing protein n=1 Tax=Streptomyces sp. NPDC001068 TaxID=3364544 RepID=UPI0036C6D309